MSSVKNHITWKWHPSLSVSTSSGFEKSSNYKKAVEIISSKKLRSFEPGLINQPITTGSSDTLSAKFKSAKANQNWKWLSTKNEWFDQWSGSDRFQSVSRVRALFINSRLEMENAKSPILNLFDQITVLPTQIIVIKFRESVVGGGRKF